MLNWTRDHSIVTFMPNRTYIFDPETSCDGCDDKNDTFFTVNIPLLVIYIDLARTKSKLSSRLCLLNLLETLDLTGFIRKLSDFNSQWTKPCTRII